jgi:cytoskeletal protein RodZ
VGDNSQLNGSETWPVIVGSVAGVLLCLGAIGIAGYCAMSSRSSKTTNDTSSSQHETTTATTTTTTTTTPPQSSIYQEISVPTNNYVDMPMHQEKNSAEYVTLGLTSSDTEYLSFVDRPQSNDDYRQDFLMAGEK